jgi:hypothetical protein
LIGFCCFFLASLASAQSVELNPAHPQSYTVQSGDTLWDLAQKFLQNPWQWPEIWHENPSIQNPHWIYPGDVLSLRGTASGKPSLEVTSPSELRLQPSIRSNPLEQAIPLIAVSDIQQFLAKHKVVEEGELDHAPYILAFPDERIVGGSGDQAYVRGLPENAGKSYLVFRQGPALQHGKSGELLGYQAIHIANAELQREGDPATVSLEQARQEALIGDRLLPVDAESVVMNFHPAPPARPVEGQIISMIQGVTQIGQFQIVIIDLGSEDGIVTGNVLSIFQSGRMQRDYIASGAGDPVRLPQEKAGELLVFHPYRHCSYALVMKANRVAHLQDTVGMP